MTGFRNLLICGKIPNFWSGNIVGIQPSNNNMFSLHKSIRYLRMSRNPIVYIKNNLNKHEMRLGFRRLPPSTSESNKILKPIVFSFAFSSASLGVAAIWQYENTRTNVKSFLSKSNLWFKDTSDQKRGKIRQEMNRLWNKLSEADKVFIPICFVNVLVFLAWQVQSYQSVMMTYFTTFPATTKMCWPLVLSVFSHYSFFHLLANMIVLHSFCTAAIHSLGKEQFVGFYMSAGCISSLASYLYKFAIGVSKPSLGASGAIMAVIGYTCSAYPNSHLSILFLPMVQFEAHLGLKALMLFDFVGLVMGWQFLDHAAHLAGAITGLAWYHYGNHIWSNRRVVVQPWHNFRKSLEK